jgi:RNase adaptor protein for sRNA GlmZ degradation
LDQLENSISKLNTVERMLTDFVQKEAKIDFIEERVRAIAETVCAPREKGPVDYSVHSQKDGRNRLKEKLKQALDQSSETSVSQLVKKILFLNANKHILLARIRNIARFELLVLVNGFRSNITGHHQRRLG